MSILSAGAISLKRRNTIIAQSGEVVVGAGLMVQGDELFSSHPDRIDMRDYAFVYYRVNAGTGHSVGWTLEHIWTWHDNTETDFAEIETIISTTERRAKSDWIEAAGTGLFVRLTNNDAISQTYKVYLFGVR